MPIPYFSLNGMTLIATFAKGCLMFQRSHAPEARNDITQKMGEFVIGLASALSALGSGFCQKRSCGEPES